jgi:hypothetical protein
MIHTTELTSSKCLMQAPAPLQEAWEVFCLRRAVRDARCWRRGTARVDPGSAPRRPLSPVRNHVERTLMMLACSDTASALCTRPSAFFRPDGYRPADGRVVTRASRNSASWTSASLVCGAQVVAARTAQTSTDASWPGRVCAAALTSLDPSLWALHDEMDASG